MTIEAHIQDGQVVLPGPLPLPNGTKVTVEVRDNQTADFDQGEIPSLLTRLRKSAGSSEHLPPDASQNVDHYLYGKPKT